MTDLPPLTDGDRDVLEELSPHWSYTVSQIAAALQRMEHGIECALERLEQHGMAERETRTQPELWRRSK